MESSGGRQVTCFQERPMAVLFGAVAVGDHEPHQAVSAHSQVASDARNLHCHGPQR